MNLQLMLRVAMMDHSVTSTGCSFKEAAIILAACERRILMPTNAMKVRREMFGDGCY